MTHKNPPLNKTLIRKIQNECLSLMQEPINILYQYRELLLPQSVLGRAHSGHGSFDQPIPQITIGEIYMALGRNPIEMKKQRDKACFEVEACFYDILKGKKNKLTNSKGVPLLGIELFEDLKIDPDKGFFKGLAFATAMDSKYWREETVKNYPKKLDGNELEIGCGEEFSINTLKMKEEGITGQDFSQKVHSEEAIEELKKRGMINTSRFKKSNLESLFIRTKKGNGCCDDACGIISLILSENPDSFYPWSLIDGIDTYAQYSELDDEIIGNKIIQAWEKKYNEKLVTSEEIMKVIYLGAKNNSPKIDLSSAHRRFFQQEGENTQETLELHKEWITGGKRPISCFFGFTRLKSDDFYDAMNQRLYNFGLGSNLKEKEVVKKPRKKNFQKIPKAIKKAIKKEIKNKIKRKNSKEFNERYVEAIQEWQESH